MLSQGNVSSAPYGMQVVAAVMCTATTLKKQFNVSGITTGGVKTVTFAAALPSADYQVFARCMGPMLPFYVVTSRIVDGFNIEFYTAAAASGVGSEFLIEVYQ